MQPLSLPLGLLFFLYKQTYKIRTDAFSNLSQIFLIVVGVGRGKRLEKECFSASAKHWNHQGVLSKSPKPRLHQEQLKLSRKQLLLTIWASPYFQPSSPSRGFTITLTAQYLYLLANPVLKLKIDLYRKTAGISPLYQKLLL